MSGLVRTIPVASGVWVVSLVGEHDISTAQALDADLAAMSRTKAGIVLDLTEATFIDNSVLNVIVTQASPRFALVIPSGGPVERLTSLVKLDTVVATFQSRVIACREVARRQPMLERRGS